MQPIKGRVMSKPAQRKTVYRLNQGGNACLIQFETTQNSTLSDRAFRVHLSLISRPENWTITRGSLAKFLNVSVRTVQNTINELKEAGLMHYTKTGPKSGYYVVSEVPFYEAACMEAAEPEIEPVQETPANEEQPEPPQEKPDYETLKTVVFAQVIARMEKVFNIISPEEREFLELKYQNFVDTLTTKTIRPDMAFNWLNKGLQDRRRTDIRVAKINAAKDKKAAAVVRLIDAQTKNLNSNTTDYYQKTTAEKLTDTSWADDLDIFDNEHNQQSGLQTVNS